MHLVEPDLEYSWMPQGGEAVIGRLGQSLKLTVRPGLCPVPAEEEPSYA